MNIGTIIDAAATGDPARAALIIDGRTISYRELAAAVERCAAGLTAGGLAGRRIAVVDVASPVSIATALAAARIGGAAALMNPALTPPELRGLVEDAECAEVGVAGEQYADRLLEAGATQGVDGHRPAGRWTPRRANARRGCRRPRRAGPVYEWHDRAAQGDPDHQRSAE